MRRKIKVLLNLKLVLKHLLYIPKIIARIKNWVPFLLNYIGLKNQPQTYYLRNGIKLKTNEGVDSETISVIFIKTDYGKIKDNSQIIDIGANIGVFSIYAVSTSKYTTVYAYEPMPKCFQLLLENIKINKYEKKIIPFELGVTLKKEKRKLFLVGGSPFNTIYTDKQNNFIEINCIGLKDIFDTNKINRCDLLKIDCEGAEFEILYNTPIEYFSKIQEIRLEYHNQKQARYTINSLIKFLERNHFKLIYYRKDGINFGSAWFKRI